MQLPSGSTYVCNFPRCGNHLIVKIHCSVTPVPTSIVQEFVVWEGVHYEVLLKQE
ncbi:hypothetical protein DPMN_075943 [Dreissena polymorpha]|uniref:Uncharacterized protein n=1 Tax=Dreissena polymorpha TaxID=45954 RepID=A0A9D3YM41_DREPO|nr:hypothetical protein DPMN_075943 [Dreissena polymorpha]